MSGEREEDQLITISIDQMLSNFSYTPSTPSIYRVSDQLRSTYEKAYDPMIIAIGPYHHGKDHLKNMENLKIRYLKMLLLSRQERSAGRYVDVIKDLEQTARECYAEVITLEKKEFVEMLLLDGIFIIEFLREYGNRREPMSPIFQYEHVVNHLLHDLVLLENQIPFFVLEGLFNLSKHDEEKISDLIWPLILPVPNEMSLPNAHHLLALVHHVRCLAFALTDSREGDDEGPMENINSATQLKEAGIIFKKPKNTETSWLDIKFKNKKIYIPMLVISDLTESLFRNMIAYEYHLPSNHQKYYSDYSFFLHCLIHSPRDAELLRRYGIISNWLGGDEMVYHLINKLGTNVQISEKFSYNKIFRSINRHCGYRRNRWIAILRRDYFNSPWKLISLVAAIILLSVGVVQTLFTILSYCHDSKS